MTRNTIGDAMHKAEQALGQIETHERICALRYEGIEKAQAAASERLSEIANGMKSVGDDMKSALKDLNDKRSEDTRGIYNRFWWFAAGIGAGMFAIIMALVAMLFKQ